MTGLGDLVVFSARLALPAADIVFDDLGLGRAPQPFEIPVVGETLPERARLREATHRTLERQGLLHRGRLDPQLEDLLTVLARAPFAVTVAGSDGGSVLLARGCSDGHDAVIAYQRGTHLTVTEARPTGVVADLIGLLPRTPSAVGASLSMPAGGAEPAPAVSAADDFANPFASARASVAAPRADRDMARVFGQRRLGLGVIAAGVRAPESGRRGSGRWRRLCQLTWWDFDQSDGAGPGRWFGSIEGEPPLLTMHPGDSARIAHYLHDRVGRHLP